MTKSKDEKTFHMVDNNLDLNSESSGKIACDKYATYEVFKKHHGLAPWTYWSDEEAWQILSEVSGTTTLSEFQKLSRPFQKHCLWEAHELGVGPRTLSRLTGVAFSIVQRATSKAKEEMFQSNIVSESSLADEEYYTYLDAGSFEQFPDY